MATSTFEDLINNCTQRADFSLATQLAEQEQVLSELDDLLAKRALASSELARLDAQASCSFTNTWCQLTGEKGEKFKTTPPNDADLLEFQALLVGRKHLTATLTQLEEALLPVFNKMGVALPPGFDLLNPEDHTAA